MPELIIDGRKIQVVPGTKVIKAAEALGIMIPRFCYHEALGSVGACRLCAVKFLDGPVKGLQMSCMIDAQDGMVVSTDHPEAVAHRKQIIEWLMMNHPHDCPVCDEGGHCLLQDETVSSRHVIRRYPGPKRTFRDQYLGVFVQHEMNRCIHCWRCRRFYQEYCGYRDLGAMQIGWRTYFGRFDDGPLESPFAGNLIQVCPTGVYTDKPARFKGRRWDFQRGPSICIHCSLGCNTVGSVKYREIMRQEARLNEKVNGWFMCDRGRFGFPFHQLPDRPRAPKMEKGIVSWEESFAAFRSMVETVTSEAGPKAIRCLGSPRASLETQVALSRFCDSIGLPSPRFFIDPERESKVTAAVARLDQRIAVSMAQIEKADFILVVGADPLNEAPMSALAIRQAWRNGAQVVVIDPRPVELPLDYDLVSVGPGDLPFALSSIAKDTVTKEKNGELSDKVRTFLAGLETIPDPERSLDGLLKKAADGLRKSKRPVIVCGTDVGGKTLPHLAADVALLLRESGWEAGLFYLLPGPNAFGAGLLTKQGNGPDDIVEAMENGEVRGLLMVESDPLFDYPDRGRLERALDRLDFLAVMDYLPSRSFKKAQVAWPTQTLFEQSASTYVNQEGRLQTAQPLCRGGIPISQIGGGDHPPRMYLGQIPGETVWSAAKLLSLLAEVLSGRKPDFAYPAPPAWLAERNLVPGKPDGWNPGPEGIRLLPESSSESDFQWTPAPDSATTEENDDRFRLLAVDRVFGTEELSSLSEFIRAAEKEPVLMMSRRDAEALGLTEGDMATLDFPERPLTIRVGVRDDMAPGILILPRNWRLDWQQMKDGRVAIPKNRIRKGE